MPPSLLARSRWTITMMIVVDADLLVQAQVEGGTMGEAEAGDDPGPDPGHRRGKIIKIVAITTVSAGRDRGASGVAGRE